MQALLAQFPQARWHQYESVSRDAAQEGAQQAFGEYVNAVYRVDRAQGNPGLDADFLCSGPGCLRYARDFARGRRDADSAGTMNRLYAVESSPSNTGAMADHRLRLRAVEIEAFARALAQQLGVAAVAGPRSHIAGSAGDGPKPRHGWRRSRRTCKQHSGASLVVAGDRQPPVVHALCHAINQRLGNFDKTVYFTAPLEVNPANQWAVHRRAGERFALRSRGCLLIMGEIRRMTLLPIWASPRFASQVKFSARLGLYEDETSALCHWHIPQTHFLEQWGDARAFDGTVSLIQPLIAPLYEGKSAYEVLALLNGEPAKSGHDIVRDFWQAQQPAGEKWRRQIGCRASTGPSEGAPSRPGRPIRSSRRRRAGSVTRNSRSLRKLLGQILARRRPRQYRASLRNRYR